MTAGDWGWTDGMVLDRARDCLRNSQRAALVTLVDVDGSAYRRPGAKRLVEPDGTDAGSIVPGCLDASVDQTVESVLKTGEPTTVTVDLQDDDGTWGLGIGCDGVVDLLVEPLDESLQDPLTAHADGEETKVLTVVDGEDNSVAVGDRAWYETQLSPIRGTWPSWLRDRIEDVVVSLDGSTTGTVTVDGPSGAVTVLVDSFDPSPNLIVFGTGHDVPPIVEAGRLAGFDVTVVGFRGGKTRPDRFPATATVRSTSPNTATEVVDVDADTAAVVATHNFVDDRLTVEGLLATPAPYVGVVGSRDRFQRLIEALDCDLSARDRSRLYGPAGLDLGGDAPSQVALGIVSEALAVTNDRRARHLRAQSGPIHDRHSME